MAEIGYFLSSEELGPADQVRYAQQAEQAGFRSLWISDHYHPWHDGQGHSPFVWSVIGGIAATTQMRITTGVTCPTIRIHPAIIAQAAATAAVMSDGRFLLGVGTGENLNEHILGDRWPSADERLEMLEEAVDVMRKLWTGELVSHDGTHYVVDRARIYSLPDEPPPVVVSAFGPKALEVAARIGDGLATVQPDADAIKTYRQQGGEGPTQAGVKVCYGPDEQAAVKTAHELWANQFLPGQLSQELALPSYFEEAMAVVTEDQVAEQMACGPDPEKHVEAISAYLEAGFDEVYVSQIGEDQAGFFEFFNAEVKPRLSL
jgi:G6PDH family F420-dependent oxidoreductase